MNHVGIADQKHITRTFDSSILSPTRPSAEAVASRHLGTPSPRKRRPRFVQDHPDMQPFQATFVSASIRDRAERNDRELFVYSPPPLREVYRKITPPSARRSAKQSKAQSPRDTAEVDSKPAQKQKPHRLLRKKFAFLFERQGRVETPKLTNAERRSFERKKRSARRVRVISNKHERWKHPGVDHAFRHWDGQQEVETQRALMEAHERERTADGSSDETKKKDLLNDGRPPSRLDEDLKNELLGKIRTHLVHNRFDWDSPGRFVPAHKPFNPRVYGNAERVYTVNSQTLVKLPLERKHAPAMDAKAKRKTKKLVFGVPPGLGTRIPDNAHPPPISPLKYVRAIKPFSETEGGWEMIGYNPELSISNTQMKAEECRKNRDWNGKYKSLGNREYYELVMSNRKREGGTTV